MRVTQDRGTDVVLHPIPLVVERRLSAKQNNTSGRKKPCLFEWDNEVLRRLRARFLSLIGWECDARGEYARCCSFGQGKIDRCAKTNSPLAFAST
jgi:hypothetical protein